MQVLDDARDVRKLRAVPETLRLGRTMGFSRTLIVDDDDPSRVIALSEGTGVSLGDTPGHYEKVDNPSILVEDSPDLPPLHQVFGATKGDDGAWRLPELSLELASPDAALHLGPQHVALETAALEAAAALAGTDRLQAESYHCMFCARGKVGPFRVVVDAHPAAGGRVGTRMTLHDEGNGDRLVTAASLVVRVVG
jgi:hypothetical protein